MTIPVTRHDIGPVGMLSDVPGFTTLGHGVVYHNLRILGGVRIKHNVTFRNCEFSGGTVGNSASYTVRHNETATHAVFEDCRVLTRIPNTKGFTSYGSSTSEWHRCVFRGGVDSVYVKPSLQGVTGYGHYFSECWFGDLYHPSGAHSDCVQMDGGPGGLLLDRCALHSFLIPLGSDPATTEAVESENNRAGGGLILTYPSTNPLQISRVSVTDCYADGGNVTMDLDPPDGPAPTDVTVMGNRFGRLHQYAALNAPPGSSLYDNLYEDTGEAV